MRRLRFLSISIAVAVSAVLVPACGGSGSDEASSDSPTSAQAETTTTAPELGTGDGTFTMTTETFTDPSRPTGATPGRAIPTDVYVPGGDGPFPLIVHNHGLDGSSAKFSQLLGDWATAGYIVVAPNFPLTNDDTPAETRSIGDFVNQPADVSFVLDRVLDRADGDGPLAGKVATDRMGVSGLSLGGGSTYPLVFHPCCRDERFRSAILMSAMELPFTPGEYDWTRPFPVMVFSGTADLAVNYAQQQAIVAKLPGPTWAVTLEGGLHAQPFENPPSPHDEVVTTTSTDFWAATLRDDAEAEARLQADATVPGVSSIVITP